MSEDGGLSANNGLGATAKGIAPVGDLDPSRHALASGRAHAEHQNGKRRAS